MPNRQEMGLTTRRHTLLDGYGDKILKNAMSGVIGMKKSTTRDKEMCFPNVLHPGANG